jgi:hypothetical protein
MGEPAAPGIQIRLAGPGDAAALTELFDAIDRHYWGSAAPSPSAMAEHVRRRVLTATSCEIALAEMDGQAVGLATFAVLYPAPGPSGQLFMKDLFTVAGARPRRAARGRRPPPPPGSSPSAAAGASLIARRDRQFRRRCPSTTAAPGGRGEGLAPLDGKG